MKSFFGTCCGLAFGEQGDIDGRVPQSEIGAVYDRIAGIYDVWGKLTESHARKRALELANIQNGESVLEVAVGTGLAFSEIVKQNSGGRNLGIDISAGMLRKAERRLQGIPGATYKLQQGTAVHLPVEDQTVDVLVNSYMFDLFSFAEMDAVLMEFRRALKPGGRLVLVNMTIGERLGSKLYDWIYRVSPRSMGGCRGVRLSPKLQNHGFQVAIREYHQQMLFPSEVILAHR